MMVVEEPTDPEFILWQNIGIAEGHRSRRQLLGQLSVFGLVIVTYVSIILFKQYRNNRFSHILEELGTRGLRGISCAAVEKGDAYNL